MRVSGGRGGPAVGTAGPQIESALVARAVEAAFFRPGDHRARQVRALLAEFLVSLRQRNDCISMDA
jgi:hypothetical protein